MSASEPAPRPGLVIAIDGPAGSGKSTLARRLADHFGLAHLDTGLIYRAVAARVLEIGADPEDQARAAAIAAALTQADLDRGDLRAEAVGKAASVVAAHPAVRAALLDIQRDFAANPPGAAPGAVLDGRDIGTVVLPTAPVKIFITAGLETRAQRRHKELQESGTESIRTGILRDMAERDRRDSGRAVAPLTAAPDALVLDTTELDADAAFAAAVAFVLARRRGESRVP